MVPLSGVSQQLVLSSDRKSDESRSGDSSHTVGDEVCIRADRSSGFTFRMLASTLDPLDTDSPGNNPWQVSKGTQTPNLKDMY